MTDHEHLTRDLQITLAIAWGCAISNLILVLFHSYVGCMRSASILNTSIGAFYFTLLFDLLSPNRWSRKLLPTGIGFVTMLLHGACCH